MFRVESPTAVTGVPSAVVVAACSKTLGVSATGRRMMKPAVPVAPNVCLRIRIAPAGTNSLTHVQNVPAPEESVTGSGSASGTIRPPQRTCRRSQRPAGVATGVSSTV